MFFLSWLDLRDSGCQMLQFLQAQSEGVTQHLALLFLWRLVNRPQSRHFPKPDFWGSSGFYLVDKRDER